MAKTARATAPKTPKASKVSISPDVLQAMPAPTSAKVQKAVEAIAKKKPKVNKLSQAWKETEKRVRDYLQDVGFLQSYRELRGSDLGESTFDVKVPEAPYLINDGKYTQLGHAIHTMWKKARDLYADEARAVSDGAEPETIIWTQEKGQSLILATVDGKFLAKLLARYFLGEGADSADWCCPRCRGAVDTTNGFMGREVHTCPRCRLTFETEKGKRKGKKQ